MVGNIIKPGDKIDIRYLHQDNDKIYMSGVFDIISEDEIEITVPTYEGKMVLFHNGFEFEFFFYTSRGMYSCEAVVTDRYKRDNFYLLAVELTTPLKKFQRREFYRLDCMIDFAYYKIPREVAELETTEDLFEVIAAPEYLEQKKLARTKDLSGGGCRFLSTEQLEVGSYVLSVIRLSNDKVDQMFYLVTEIIASEKIKEIEDRWITRGRFEFKNKKDRDLIIRYVFEEDRMLRKKEIGEG